MKTLSRNRDSTTEFLLRVNLRSGSDVRRFSQVRVDQNDNVYVFQPRKEENVKISYHESGQRHLKFGNGSAMFVMNLDRPEWICSEEQLWEKSSENFDALVPYNGQAPDGIFEIDLPGSSNDAITFAQISIGKFGSPQESDRPHANRLKVRKPQSAKMAELEVQRMDEDPGMAGF